ncbi:PREDICTED: uncharacterized protein LOC106106543 [Papilio polytes]|uniref:uncharacterized protein LOC106106543 n=1 Tax=Papilio polytes TaxID=76194 RepID=UPI000676093D|nr:PREDICTED: uncharacterized protein LOC106106543 [Papilio polytes]
MNASHALRYSCILTLFLCLTYSTALGHSSQNEDVNVKKVQVYDGVYVTVPKGNDTDRLVSLEIQTQDDSEIETGRGKKVKSKKLLQKLLPMFIMPFLIQSAIVPFFLSMLKFMLFKSLMVGKLALGLIMLNAFKNSNSFKGRDAEIANVHYGYHGNSMHEYGAYIN